MLETLAVVLLEVAAPRAIEVLEGGKTVAAVDGRSGLAQLAVGVRSQGGEEPYRFDTIETHTRADGPASVETWTKHAPSCGG